MTRYALNMIGWRSGSSFSLIDLLYQWYNSGNHLPGMKSWVRNRTLMRRFEFLLLISWSLDDNLDVVYTTPEHRCKEYHKKNVTSVYFNFCFSMDPFISKMFIEIRSTGLHADTWFLSCNNKWYLFQSRLEFPFLSLLFMWLQTGNLAVLFQAKCDWC